MANKTLRELIERTQDFHEALAERFERSAKQTSDERMNMLLTYLADHEKKLAQLVGAYGEQATETALNTWVSDYEEQFAPSKHDTIKHPYASMNTEEIMNELHEQHRRLIHRYKHLRDFVESTGKELLQHIIEVEEQEILRLSQSANRLEDI